MSHEDLRDCIDPIRTPAERQISALQQRVARLTAGIEERKDLLMQSMADTERMRQERDALKRHLDAIAEALGLDKAWHQMDDMWICDWCEIALDAPDEHTCRPGKPAAYQPDQLPEMVMALREKLDSRDIGLRAIEASLGTLKHTAALDNEDEIADWILGEVGCLINLARNQTERITTVQRENEALRQALQRALRDLELCVVGHSDPVKKAAREALDK